MSIEGVHVISDAQGRFLLADLSSGHHVLRVDGVSASTPDRRFGLFDIGVDLDADRTTTLPYPIWMPPLDTEHTVRFPSPADREVLLTTPAIPGLEVHLPRGAVIRDAGGKVVTELGITNGRWISFSYDSGNRITRAEDNLGRAVTYSYTPDGHLATVTDATGATTTYTYDAQGRLATARDPRGTVYLTNTYDPAGRVATQTMADGSAYQLSYLTDSAGKVTETRLTDPRRAVRRVTFNAAGFLTTDTAGYGTPEAQTTPPPAGAHPPGISSGSGRAQGIRTPMTLR